MENLKNKINSFELVAIHFKKELRAIFKDSGALLILIGAMLIYPIVYSFGYFNETLIDLPTGVVDLDQSLLSRKYAGMLDASKDVAVTMEPHNLKEAEQLFLENKIDGVVLIPKDFQKNVLSGKQANVAVYADGSYFLKYKTLFTAASVVNAYFSGGISVKRYMLEGKSFEQASICANPLSSQGHILYNPASAYGSFVMPGLIIIIIQQTLLIGIGIMGGSFSESKGSPFVLSENRRMKEIIPYLFGKAGAYVFISMINIALAVIWVHDWFNYPDKSNIIEVLMLLFPFLIATIFLGMAISTLFRHRESSIVFMLFLSPIALFFSGVSWPVSAIPDWLTGLSKILPGTNAVPAYLRLRTMGVGIENLKSDLWFLYGQAAIYVAFTIFYSLFRTKAEQKQKKKVLIA